MPPLGDVPNSRALLLAIGQDGSRVRIHDGAVAQAQPPGEFGAQFVVSGFELL